MEAGDSDSRKSHDAMAEHPQKSNLAVVTKNNDGNINGKIARNRCYLALSNPTKTNHLGTVLRCAAAFDVHQVLLVGYDKFNSEGSFGSHNYLDIVTFTCWEKLQEYCYCGDGEDVDSDAGAVVGWSDCSSSDVEASNAANKKLAPPFDKNKSEEFIDRENKLKSVGKIAILGILGAYGGGSEIYSPKGMSVYEHADTGFVSLVPPTEDLNGTNSGNKEFDRKSTSGGENDDPCTHSTSSISYRSLPIHHRLFSSCGTKNICFLLSKDRRGIPIPQARLCHGFVHVPHIVDDSILLGQSDSESHEEVTSSSKSASNEGTPQTCGVRDELDVEQSVPKYKQLPLETTSPSAALSSSSSAVYDPNTAPISPPRRSQSPLITSSNLLETPTILSIVLHHFTAWARYAERNFLENQKFALDARPSRGARDKNLRNHTRIKKINCTQTNENEIYGKKTKTNGKNDDEIVFLEEDLENLFRL